VKRFQSSEALTMESVLDVDVSNFEKEILRSEKLILVEFWHEK
jgi:thioredoxin-like negative regulator of GroEL